METDPVRCVDSVSLLFPPKELVIGLANLPLHCRELVLAGDFDFGVDMFDLLLDSTGQTLESLTIRSTFHRGSTVTLNNCPILRKLKTKAPLYSGMLAYIDDQARLIRSITSPFLAQIAFLGKWEDPQMNGIIDWLEPMKWEIVDRELCDLMDRLDEEVKLEAIFADGVSREVSGAGYEQPDGARSALLNGMRAKGGVVKIQREEVSSSFVLLR